MATISNNALLEMPHYFHIVKELNDQKGMSGENHPYCVLIEWISDPRVGPRRAIFDAETGEYITECLAL